MKKSFWVIVLVVGLLLAFGLQSTYAAIALKDADNKMCPVTKMDIKEKRYYVSYEGYRYWCSSADAVRKFRADPEKYTKNLEISPTASSSTSSKKQASDKNKKWW